MGPVDEQNIILIFSHLGVSIEKYDGLSKSRGFLQTRMNHMNMNFEYFRIQKWTLKTVRAEKVDEKNGVNCLVSMFPSWVMVLKLS